MGHLVVDELTGAFQRAGLTELLNDLARRHESTGAHFALVMFDLDHLKTLNDVYGHATGDAALKAVAERSARVLRAGDRLVRYGGDEFLLVLPGTTLEVAEAVARRVAVQVTANPVEAAVWVHVHLSMGVAATDEAPAAVSAVAEPGVGPNDREPEPGYHPLAARLFGRADTRLYLAKRAGRNMVVAHDIATPADGNVPLRETRLVGRDEHLARIDKFLTSSATSADERALHLTGPAGAGFTRMLDEVTVRARIAGRVVRRLVASESDRGVYLRAVARAYEQRLPPDPSEEEVAEALAQDAEGHGLVVLLEEGRWLDPGSRALLAHRLREGGTRLVEAVPDGGEGLFNPGSTVALDPFSAAQTRAWLSAALGAAVDPETGEALARVGEGRPAVIARLVGMLARRLSQEGTPPTAARLASVSPAVVLDLAPHDQEAAREPTVFLPQWPDPLVGRSRWLAGALQAVGGARLTVLVGEGGVGKSRLAAQLARELAQEHPGGTHWIDLRAVQSAAVVPGLIADHLGMERTEDILELGRALDERPRLLVLDELDGMADQVGWVGTLLAAAPSLRVLATSRMPLRLVDERYLEVPELTVASACELFRRGLEREGGGEHVADDELTALVEQVGLNPLAVEMAAAWTRALSVAELRDRLSHHPEILIQAPGLAQRTARFIDITRQLMSEWEQETLGTLALMPAGFLAETARNATEASPFYLLALLERSLIRREGERYTVHAAVAERYRAGLRRPDVARVRVVGALAGFAEGILNMEGPERTGRGYRLVDAERANLVFALKLAAGSGDTEVVWPLVKLLRAYHDVRARAREGLEVFTYVAHALARCPDTELRAWVEETIALFEHQTGSTAASEARMQVVLKMLEPLGPTMTMALALNTAGIMAANGGRNEEALAALERSADMRAQLADAVGEAQARGNIAIVLSFMAKHSEAYVALGRALEKYREVGQPAGVALTLFNLAELGRTQGLMPLEECIALARESLKIAEGVGYTACARDAAAELASGLEAAGRKDEARSALERALDWARLSPSQGIQAELAERLRQLDAS